MEYAFLLFAFACGLTVKLIGIPPLVGYLVAGFLLNFAGYTLTEDLTQIANLGITIMLFTIGLKLNIRDLSRREVWGGSVTHTLVWVGIITCCVYLLGAIAANFVDGLSWKSAALIAFALSFSSTVCVVKVLEESGESKTRHGRLAIGILVMKALSIFFLGSLKKYKPIQAQNVAKAMVAIAQNHNKKTVFESNELNEIGRLI